MKLASSLVISIVERSSLRDQRTPPTPPITGQKEIPSFWTPHDIDLDLEVWKASAESVSFILTSWILHYLFIAFKTPLFQPFCVTFWLLLFFFRSFFLSFVRFILPFSSCLSSIVEARLWRKRRWRRWWWWWWWWWWRLLHGMELIYFFCEFLLFLRLTYEFRFYWIVWTICKKKY